MRSASASALRVPPRPNPPASIPTVESATIPPKSQDVGFETPMTTTKPTDATTMTNGRSRMIGFVGTTRGTSGGASRCTSPAGGGVVGGRGGRRNTCVPTAPSFPRTHHRDRAASPY